MRLRFQPILCGGLFLLVILFGVWLRFWQIDSRSVWHDEGLSVAFARVPAERFFEVLSYDVHPPFYYMALRGWMRISPSIGWGRVFSVVCALITIFLTWEIARQLSGKKAAVIATSLMALSPEAIHFSQELRMYSLQAVLVAGMALSGIHALKNPKTGKILAVITLGTLACYTHYFSAVFLVGFLIVMLWTRGSGEKSFGAAIIRTALAAFFAWILYLPWLRIALSHFLLNSQGGLYQSSSSGLNGSLLLGQAVECLLGLAPTIPFDSYLPPTMRAATRISVFQIVVAVSLILVAWGGWRSWRVEWQKNLFIAFLLIPIVLSLTFQLAGGRFYGRFYLAFLPMVYAFLATGIIRLPRRWHRWAAILLLVMPAASSAYSVMKYDIREVSYDAAKSLERLDFRHQIVLHATPQSFWSLRAYDRHPERHFIMAGVNVPALIQLTYGDGAILTARELRQYGEVLVVYGEWSAGPPQLRKELESSWFGEDWLLANQPVLFSRFIKKIEIAHYFWPLLSKTGFRKGPLLGPGFSLS